VDDEAMTADAATPAAGVVASESNLARLTRQGHFALAVEVSPPVGPNLGALQRQIELLRGYGDAYNVTDNQSAKIHTSSLAACIVLKQAGIEPVVQFTCRDRNRLGLQSDLLGAALFDLQNVLALSGDHPACGDHPHVQSVGDIDSINLVRMIRRMRDDQVFESGKTIPKLAPKFFIGAVANPFAPPFDYRPYRLAKKVQAGAQFIQTQLVFNLERFREFMQRVVDLGLHEKTVIMAGIGPVRSLRAAEYMANQVPGLEVPDSVVARLRGLSKEDQEKAGLDLCCEIGEAVRSIEGVKGLHIMAIGWPAAVPEIVRNLGLYPRPRATAGTSSNSETSASSSSAGA
jgi:methylenetetrahydrofolate reductase (NADPH)